MAVADQLNINTGTESSPNYVLHNLQDYRLNHLSTLTTTISDIIGRNGSTFGAITPANLASVLGGCNHYVGPLNTSTDDMNNVVDGTHLLDGSKDVQNKPASVTDSYWILETSSQNSNKFQKLWKRGGSTLFTRFKSTSGWQDWIQLIA